MFYIPVPQLQFLVVTSGWSGNQLSKTETLSIGNNAQSQSQYQDHTRKIYGATGGFFNNYFITCGGVDSVEDHTDKCYMLGSEEPFATMMTIRSYAASIVLDDQTMWILGGLSWIFDEQYMYSVSTSLSSTEYIFSDGRNEEGPPMPMALYGHAMVKINETTSFLVGGYIWGFSKNSWFYDGEWIDGPDLEKGRYYHSVGIVRDPATYQDYLVVAGGYDGTYLNDVKIMHVDATTWETGKLCSFNKT